ncbi:MULTISPECIES: hypothetical protein [Dyella]|uniref:Uncharacterized protein n=2 Tax=Dyella TaxID=231454 RepID=A0A4R0YPE6_9GAMM|nr:MULTISPECIES: hypothetical protein [Dyella]TBR36673.1 hypothetical protein EYV96_12160 [Dyella terrae]TCI08236.1 hypothetical protein EZM97_26710 [Dyella soli]
MKLLRDFFRLRTAGRALAGGRRASVGRAWTITVPAPLEKPQAQVIDMHWTSNTKGQRPEARWHGHAAKPALRLVSSH